MRKLTLDVMRHQHREIKQNSPSQKSPSQGTNLHMPPAMSSTTPSNHALQNNTVETINWPSDPKSYLVVESYCQILEGKDM